MSAQCIDNLTFNTRHGATENTIQDRPRSL
jgi:hypothetical protein